MMELIKLFLRDKILISLLALLFFSSCQEKMQEGILECILESVEIDTKEVDILVGQINGWTDSTALISIIYHQRSIKIPRASKLKGIYKGFDIYFNQSNLDTSDVLNYKQIPNNINWNDLIQEKLDDEFITPPYDPKSIQIEYNIKSNCMGDIIKGKGFIKDSFLSKCNCKS